MNYLAFSGLLLGPTAASLLVCYFVRSLARGKKVSAVRTYLARTGAMLVLAYGSGLVAAVLTSARLLSEYPHVAFWGGTLLVPIACCGYVVMWLIAGLLDTNRDREISFILARNTLFALASVAIVTFVVYRAGIINPPL